MLDFYPITIALIIMQHITRNHFTKDVYLDQLIHTIKFHQTTLTFDVCQTLYIRCVIMS